MRISLIIGFLLCSLLLFGQNVDRDDWKDFKREHDYRKLEKSEIPDRLIPEDVPWGDFQQENGGKRINPKDLIKTEEGHDIFDREQTSSGDIDWGNVEWDDKPIVEIDPPQERSPAPFNPLFSNTFLWILVFVGLGVILAFVIKGIYFRNRDNLAEENISEEEEELVVETEETIFNKRIAEAEANGDYRQAIRLRFLLILKGLNDNGTIYWHKEKTNYEYLREVNKKMPRSNFEQVLRVFEWVWYGDYPINENEYSMVKPGMDEFRNKIKR